MVQASSCDEFFHRMTHNNPGRAFLFDYGLIFVKQKATPIWSSLMVRLLEGSPLVLSLLGKIPFPDVPPARIRLLVYRYHFTDR